MNKVYLNGEYVAPDKATVSVFDRGFLFSDSVYEVVQVCDNKLFLFEEHLVRLKRSLNELGILEPKVDLLDVCKKLLSFAEVEYGGIYIQVSRGVQNKRSHFWEGSRLEPFVVAFLQKLPAPEVKSLKVITQPDLRWQRCDVKSTSLLANVMARNEAAKEFCDEALLVNQHDNVGEGSSTNLFIVINGKIITPPLTENILPGITRDFCLRVIKELGLDFAESVVSKKQLLAADEVWLTSSTKDILPVGEIDGESTSFKFEGSIWEKVFNAVQGNKNKYLI